jgi:hypothetical protein
MQNNFVLREKSQGHSQPLGSEETQSEETWRSWSLLAIHFLVKPTQQLVDVLFSAVFLHSQAVPLRFECLDHTGHNPATGMAFSGKQLAPGQHSSANAAATLCK